MQRPFAFTPLVEFTWTAGGITIGHYLPGLTYTVRTGALHDDLADKVDSWLADGKIALGAAAAASIEGS